MSMGTDGKQLATMYQAGVETNLVDRAGRKEEGRKKEGRKKPS
jgi:hypothetical protein